MPFTGPLFKFALFQARRDEFYLFWCVHHIVVDGSGIALIGQRLAAVYSAIVSGAPIPAAFFGSVQDLVACELGYEASKDYLEDQTYWTQNLPAESGARYHLPQAAVERDRLGLLRRFRWTPWSFAASKSYPRVECASIIGHHRGVRASGPRVVR